MTSDHWAGFYDGRAGFKGRDPRTSSAAYQLGYEKGTTARKAAYQK